MKNNWINKLSIFCLPCLLIIGCSKNDTNYYADAEQPGLAIFSDKGNELMSCYVATRSWQTFDRKTYLVGGRTDYEVYIEKLVTNGPLDTLYISWQGHFSEDDSFGNIRLLLPVAKNFNSSNFSALQGRRLSIDTTNGYFSTDIIGLNNEQRKGSGNIFFLTAQFDSIAPGLFEGKMSGLFDADFAVFKIANGRFDHSLNAVNTGF